MLKSKGINIKSCFAVAMIQRQRKPPSLNGRKDAALKSGLLLGKCPCVLGTKELINDATNHCL